MWMKSNYIQSTVNSTYFQSSANEPREEQAIEEDGHGPLGGLIWPPRSYSCSFCKREFRSPQALGGHMNVHRRDRARLNQPALCLKPCNNMLSSTSPSNHDSDTCNEVACLYHERKKESSVETSLSVGLNFGVSRYDQAAEDIGGCKKRRTSGPPVPFLFIACSSSDRDIDLELRLGVSPT